MLAYPQNQIFFLPQGNIRKYSPIYKGHFFFFSGRKNLLETIENIIRNIFRSSHPMLCTPTGAAK